MAPTGDPNSTARSSQSNLLRLADVVEQYALSPTSIRRATASNLLPCFRTPGNHRRFRHSDILDFLTKHRGESSENVGQEEIHNSNGLVPIALCVRVSGHTQGKAQGQAEKSSLEHQEDRVRAYIADRWSDTADITLFRSIGSGLNFSRPALVKLIEATLNGDFRGGYIVCTTFDRLARFGIQLLELLAARGGCQIVYSAQNDDEERGLNESLADEVLSLLTYYTAKASSQKSREITIVRLSEEQLKYAYELKISGDSYRGIVLKFARKGWQNNDRGKKISHVVIRSRLKESWDVLQKLYSQPLKNNFLEFQSSHISKAHQREGTRQIVLAHSVIMRAYKKYCAQKEIKPCSSRVVRASIKKLGWEFQQTKLKPEIYLGISMSFYDNAKPAK